MAKLKVLILTLMVGLFAACATGCATVPPPVEDYVLAKTALDAARAIDSARYSPGFFAKAETAFRKAKVFFDDRDYEKARDEFRASREFSEKAENTARMTQFKTGEVVTH
jgi:hypothetical protein